MSGPRRSSTVFDGLPVPDAEGVHDHGVAAIDVALDIADGDGLRSRDGHAVRHVDHYVARPSPVASPVASPVLRFLRGRSPRPSLGVNSPAPFVG
jgi:hypothetical protein